MAKKGPRAARPDSVLPPAHPAPPGPASRVRRSRLLWLAALVAVGAAAYLAVGWGREAAYAARLPTLPDVSGQTAAVRAHLTDADRAARSKPTSARVVGALGLAYLADMFYDQADQTYSIAESLARSEWRWSYYRALAKDARGDGSGAIATLEKVVADAPAYGPAWWRLGDAQFKAGRYDRAEEAWRRVLPLAEPPRPAASQERPARVAVAPVSAYATLGLARIALARDQADRARELLEPIATKTSRFGPAFRLLGTVYAQLNRAQDAERAVRTADKLPAFDPYFDPVFDDLARESKSSTFLLQQAAAADVSTNGAWREFLIRRALEFDPGNTDALYELASMLRVLRRFDEALALLERYRRLVPDDFQALADIGRCLSGLQRLGEAEGVLRRALVDLDDASTHYDLGFVLDRAGRLEEAVAEYRRALDRNPNHKDALNNLAIGLMRQRRPADAARLLERLTSLDPDNADAHVNLGVVLLAQGARGSAAREFQRALDVNPDHARARDGLRQAAP